LAQKRGFLQEEDLQAEVIRINATADVADLTILREVQKELGIKGR
jgi:hypothetical protein